MRTFGFGAVGRAGNASPPPPPPPREDALLVRWDDDGAGLGRGEGRADWVVDAREGNGDEVAVAAGVPHAVEVFLRAPGRGADDDGEERGGNGLLEDADAEAEAEEGRAPLLPTAERDDCAVDDFNRRTRLPPAPLSFMVFGDMPGSRPPGPGRAG